LRGGGPAQRGGNDQSTENRRKVVAVEHDLNTVVRGLGPGTP
jgi:hypothetical protein